MNDSVSNPYAPATTVPEEPWYPAVGERPLATRGERFAGAFIDGLVIIVPVLVVAFPAGFALALVLDPDSAAFDFLAGLIGVLLGFGIFLAINGYLLAHYGQTVGKRLIGTQIVSNDNQLVPFGRLALYRYLVFYLLSAVPLVGGLINLINVLAIFRSSRKCLHDDVAGTKVIRVR